MFPRYSYPPALLVAVICDALLGRRRSFRQDAQKCLACLKPPLRLLGAENLPQQGPCVVTVNHYYRPGFRAEWLALAISATVPLEVHWIMTGELTFPGKWYAPLGSWLSRLLLRRGARLYGFTTMPPMPPRPQDVVNRAAAVHSVLEYVKRTEKPVLGLAPEGGDQPAGKLAMPASGAGRFALLLAATGLKFHPVGAYEQGGEFILHFGPPYHLDVPAGLPTEERDRLAARRVMEHIAALLPAHLRGEFQLALAQTETR
jgi:1-acyl-sn-glycerol-3-phosphate acyltransferase